jgi:hypothetical protein
LPQVPAGSQMPGAPPVASQTPLAHEPLPVLPSGSMLHVPFCST